jgi:putative flippase GtrA
MFRVPINVKIGTEFARFCTVGVVSNTLLYLTYLAVTALGMGHKLAMTLLYILGVLVTFTFNRRWSFAHDGLVAEALPRYILAYVGGYLLNLLLLWTAVDHFGLPHRVVQGVSILIVAVTMFLLHRLWVFKPARGTVSRDNVPSAPLQ